MQQVSVKEAAELLGITDRAVRMRIQSRKLAAIRNGGQWLVLIDESAIADADAGRNRNNFADAEDRNAVTSLSESIVDAWANRTIGEVARLSHEVGVLTAQLDAVTRERDALITLMEDEQSKAPIGFWRWLRGLTPKPIITNA